MRETQGGGSWPRAMRAAVAGAVVSGLLLAAALIHTLFQDDEWDPLGTYAGPDGLEQTVQNTRVTDDDGTPLFDIDDVLPVVGTKCVEWPLPVKITGKVSWLSMDPRGTVIPTGEGATVREPGCDTVTFENDVPDAVREATREAINRDPSRAYVKWRITGTEVPTDERGRRGASRTWVTDVFALGLPDG